MRDDLATLDHVRGRTMGVNVLARHAEGVPDGHGWLNATITSEPFGISLEAGTRVHVESLSPGGCMARVRRCPGDQLVIVEARRVRLDEHADPPECVWWECPGIVRLTD